MATSVIDGTNIDLSVFSYSSPKPNAAGGKVVNLYNKLHKESLTLAVPLMPSWGAQEVMEFKKDANGQHIKLPTGKYNMTLQFAKGQYATPESDQFLEQMKRVEQKIKEDAMVYSKEWFGKEIKSMDVMDEKISPMLKYPKVSKDSEERDYNQPPQLTVKLPCWKGVWQPSVFDEDYNPLYIKGKSDDGVTPLDFLKCQSKAPIHVICLIQCGGLWFVGSPAKVSITWNLKQVIVRKPKQSVIPDDTCFLSVKPSDKAILSSQPETEVNNNDEHVSTLVEDTDNEEEEEYMLPPPKVEKVVEEPKKEPEPVVVEEEKPKTEVKKKIIRKTKPKV